MTSYGYRLFELAVYEGRKRAPLNFAECQGAHYFSHARRWLKSAQDETFAGPVVALRHEDTTELDNTGRQLLLVDGLRGGANMLFGSVMASKVGSIPSAIGVPGVSLNLSLKDHGPGREPSRFAILLPDGPGLGLVAVESVGRSCPSGAIRYALTQMSIRDWVASGADAQEDTQAHLRAKLTPISDPEHLEKVVAANHAAEIKLTRRGTGFGRGRENKELEVFAAAVSVKSATKVIDLLKAWREAKKSGNEVSDRQGAAELAQIVGGDALAELEFDEGSLTLDDNGRLKMVTPALSEEIFTYPLGRRLSDKEWFFAVAAQAQSTVQGSEVAVAWPAWNQLRTVR
ncbi:MAG: hypothetical protein ACR2IK_25480 [Chloroflexota bacterium]